MGKTITIGDDVYRLLSSLKQGAGDSFSDVLRRHIHKPAETFGEQLHAYEQYPPPHQADLARLDRIERERGRRSGGRK
jgi:negative regulator of replication initiation